jgi:hypothetical protein
MSGIPENDRMRNESSSVPSGGTGVVQGRILLNLVSRARRRFLHNELMAQGANAASAALMAFILLLVVGTQILDWRWIALIGALAAAAGLYRAGKRLPSAYAVAQAVDHRLDLADAVSTALYFSQEPAPAGASPEIRELQMEQASRMAESADVHAAVPYTMPRAVYLVGALLVIAGSLFALRYGLSSRLDLKPTLASLLPYQLPWQQSTEGAKNMGRRPPQLPDPQDDSGAALANPDQDPAGDPDPTANDNSDGAGDPNTEKSAASKGQSKPGEKGGQAGDADQEAKAEQGNDPQGGENAGQQGNNKQDSKQASAGKQEQGNSGESGSLMNKVKDLFQNLLSSVKPPQTNPSNQQQNSDPNNQQGKGQQNAGKQDGKNGQQENNGNPGDSEQGQSGEQAKSPQDPQGKGDGKSDSQQASKQPGSGIGNQNGDKTIKQAEDLAAMGKITELFGKRSASITGEATVEVQATSQQLHTPYAPRGAEHSQNGAEISRDEIPVAMQPYVQQYFEQVRKQAAQAPAAKKQ